MGAAAERPNGTWVQKERSGSWEAADLQLCLLQVQSDLQGAQWGTAAQWPETEAHPPRETNRTPATSSR